MANRRLDVQAALASLPICAQLTQAQLANVASATRILRAVRGEMLFAKGDAPTGFYVLLRGQVKLALSSPQGVEKVLQLVGPGHSFGEAAMFLERPYPVYAQALADSVLLHVAQRAVFAAIEANPDFAHRMLGGLSRRLHELVGDVEAYSMRSAAQRLVGYLLNLCATDAGTVAQVTLPTSKHLVASRLNLTPETLSRVLHLLADDDLIRVKGRTLTIIDFDRLRSYG